MENHTRYTKLLHLIIILLVKLNSTDFVVIKLLNLIQLIAALLTKLKLKIFNKNHIY